MIAIQSSRYETNVCDQCYRVKQSCTKHIPQCQRCLKASTPCTYSFGKFMGKPKKRTKRHREQENEARDDGEPTATQTQATHKATQDVHPESEAIPKQAAENTVRASNSSSSATHNGEGGLKRSSKLSACDQCYRFKVKCVPNGASCHRCTGNNTTCTYSLSSASEEDECVEPPTSEHAAKRCRISELEQQLSLQTRTPDQSSTCCLNQNQWLGTSQAQSIFEQNSGSLEGSNYNNIAANNNRQTFPTSIDTHDEVYDFSFQTDNLDSIISPYSPLNFDAPSIDLSYTNCQVLSLPMEADSGEINNGQESNLQSECACLVSALSALTRLHEIGQPAAFTKTTLDPNQILSITRDSLLICGKIGNCKSCSRYTMLMICITILQQIIICYEVLPSSVNGHNMSPPLSIKIGDMEFSDVAYAPGIMQAVLSGERKKAERVCENLLNVYGRDGDMMGNMSKLGAGMRELLEILKQSFGC